MHFTVAFRAHEACDLSYGLVFIPCPAWVRGENVIINLNPQTPKYQPGSVQALLSKESILVELEEGNQECIVIIHPAGHGTASDLEVLEMDLRDSGFSVKQLSF